MSFAEIGLDDTLNVTDEQAVAALCGTVSEIAEAMGVKIALQVEGKANEVDRNALFNAIRRHTMILSHIVTRSDLAELYIAESEPQTPSED